jgi:histidine triad (HIT) family protein
MARDSNCIFCKIVAVELPAAVVFESESLIAFLDVGPLAEGHLLLVPREHYTLLTELPPALALKMGSVLPRLGRALLEVTGADGFNVLQSNGEAAGQIVPHVHFHLIPRTREDGLGYRWNAGKYGEGRAEALAAKYQTALSRRQD